MNQYLNIFIDKKYPDFIDKYLTTNTIPLIRTDSGDKRITEVSEMAKNIYDELNRYKDSTYAYVLEIIDF